MAYISSSNKPFQPVAGHAVVIGGSMAGMVAARVLADAFERVTIVERDQLTDGPEPRKSVPQARHLHVLLTQGYRILTQLFPGIEADLAAAGAPLLTWTHDMKMLLPSGWAPRFDSDLASYACSRDLLDWLIRRRLLANGRIRFIMGHQVAGLLATPDNSRITGVRLRMSSSATSFSPYQKEIPADLVVDASGRTSHLPDWLSVLGYNPPEETTVNAFLGYASRWYEAPIDFSADCQGVVVGAQPPVMPRGGVVLPAENGRFIVTLGGTAGDYPPTDETEFLAFARSLPDPTISQFIQAATPTSSISGYQRTENRWRHYERLPQWPEGLIALGDAVCAFNPVYGQGMTVSALGAIALRACLEQERPNSPLTGFASRFQKRLAKVVEPVWLLATGEDFRWPTTEGKRSWATRLAHRYQEHILDLIPSHLDIARTFFEVIHLVSPSTALFQPSILRRVLPRMLRLNGKRPNPPDLQLVSPQRPAN